MFETIEAPAWVFMLFGVTIAMLICSVTFNVLVLKNPQDFITDEKFRAGKKGKVVE